MTPTHELIVNSDGNTVVTANENQLMKTKGNLRKGSLKNNALRACVFFIFVRKLQKIIKDGVPERETAWFRRAGSLSERQRRSPVASAALCSHERAEDAGVWSRRRPEGIQKQHQRRLPQANVSSRSSNAARMRGRKGRRRGGGRGAL